MFYGKRCIGCGKCAEVYKHEALNDRDKCNSCGSCAEVCYAKARELVGKLMTVQEVMEQLDKYNRLGKQSRLLDIPVLSDEYVESVADQFLKYGIKVKI